MSIEATTPSSSVHATLYSDASQGIWNHVNEHIAKGADPAWNHPETGKSAIHLAAESGELASLMEFVAADAGNASIRDSYGDTPLHKAAGEGKLEICKYLCDTRSVDPNLRNSTMQTAVDLAVEGFHTETAAYLNEYIAAKKATLKSSLWNLSDLLHRQLYEATIRSEIDNVSELLSRGADPCWSNPKKGEGGKTAIHIAAELGNVPLLSLLLSKQTKNRATIRDSFGETPLHKAAAEGRLDTCKFLIVEMGADPNLRNATLQTASDLSIENDQLIIQEYLSSFTSKKN